MADEFAGMLKGITGQGLREQWQALPSLTTSARAFAPRPILLVAAGKDAIFPASHYADFIAELPNIQLIRNEESDHGFSACRPWLARTVTDWLVATLGASLFSKRNRYDTEKICSFAGALPARLWRRVDAKASSESGEKNYGNTTT
jgi:hypothetical protein